MGIDRPDGLVAQGAPSEQIVTLVDATPRGEATVLDNPFDARPRRRLRRLGAVSAVFAYLAIVCVIGAATSVGVGLAATNVATLLYAVAAAAWCVLVAVAVTLWRRTRRSETLPLRGTQALAVVPAVAGALQLAAAYVSRLNGQPFWGGVTAMIVTTVTLVSLSQKHAELGIGRRRPPIEHDDPARPGQTDRDQTDR